MSYTRCPAFAAQPAPFVPVPASPALDLSSRLSSQFRSRYRLLLRRPRLPLRRPRSLPRRFRRSSESSWNKAPEQKPSRRGMYTVNLSRQAYLHRHSIHCLLSSVYCPRFIILGSSYRDSPIPRSSPPILVRSARHVCGAALVLVPVYSSPRSSSRPQPPTCPRSQVLNTVLCCRSPTRSSPSDRPMFIDSLVPS